MFSEKNHHQTSVIFSDKHHKNIEEAGGNKMLAVRPVMIVCIAFITLIGFYGCDDSNDELNTMTEVIDMQVSDDLADSGALVDQEFVPADAEPADMGETPPPMDAMLSIDMAEDQPPLDASMTTMDATVPEPVDAALPEPEPTICGDEQERFQCLPACSFIRQCVFEHCDLSRQSDADLLGLHNRECVSSDCEGGQTAICDLPVTCASLLDVASQIPHVRDLIRSNLCNFPTP